MLTAQLVCTFIVWVAFGIWRRPRPGGPPRRGRSPGILSGVAWLVYGAAVLLGGVAAVQALGGLGHGGLTMWGWLGVTLVGIEFVRAQMAAVSAMLAVTADTPARPQSSMIQREEEPEP